MPMPRKGSRTLTVEAVRYRWVGRLLHYDEPSLPGEIVVELAEGAREKIRAQFSFDKLRAEYRRVGKRIDKYWDRIRRSSLGKYIIY